MNCTNTEIVKVNEVNAKLYQAMSNNEEAALGMHNITSLQLSGRLFPEKINRIVLRRRHNQR